MKEVIIVEGVTWGVAPVISQDKTQADFVKRHIDDPGTYPALSKERKTKVLMLIWDEAQKNAPKPEAKEAKIAPVETPVEKKQ
jgi:hypothetical protein